MPTNSAAELRRLKNELADLDHYLINDTRNLTRMEEIRDRSLWSTVRFPSAFTTVGLTVTAFGIFAQTTHLAASRDWPALIFLGVVLLIGGITALIGAVEERGKAPQVLASVRERIVELENRKAEVAEAIDALTTRQSTLADNTLWLNNRLASLATATGWPDEDVARMGTVLSALSDDLRMQPV